MERDIDESGMKCASCLALLDYAARAWLCREGVIGATGFVASWPNGDYFCSAACVISWLEQCEPAVQKPRMP